MWKDAPHHESLGKYNSEPRWYITSYTIGWLLYLKKNKKNKGICFGENVSKLELWYSPQNSVLLVTVGLPWSGGSCAPHRPAHSQKTVGRAQPSLPHLLVPIFPGRYSTVHPQGRMKVKVRLTRRIDWASMCREQILLQPLCFWVSSHIVLRI